MTTIGQVTATGKWHLNLHGLAACGTGTGRIIKATVQPATAASAYGKICRTCQRGLRRALTLVEAADAMPAGGYKVHYHFRSGTYMIFGPNAQNWSTASPWDALQSARKARGAQVRAMRAAKAERERAARHRTAGNLHCRECGCRLSDQDLLTPVVPGYCFNCV